MKITPKAFSFVYLVQYDRNFKKSSFNDNNAITKTNNLDFFFFKKQKNNRKYGGQMIKETVEDKCGAYVLTVPFRGSLDPRKKKRKYLFKGNTRERYPQT